LGVIRDITDSHGDNKRAFFSSFWLWPSEDEERSPTCRQWPLRNTFAFILTDNNNDESQSLEKSTSGLPFRIGESGEFTDHQMRQHER
jgi:hypothetical protein